MAWKAAKDNCRETTIPAEVKRIYAGIIAAFGGDSLIFLEALLTGRSIFPCQPEKFTTYR